ncbi:MAG: hypothetical protein M9949_10195 [Candidatus Kapabacteria bacterium]|nr:hypothetical protein [Candidatus Kapabacteria bacterium]
MHNSDNANFSWAEGNMIAPDKLSDWGKSILFGFVAEFQPSETAKDAFQFRFSYNSYSFQSDYNYTNNYRTESMPEELIDSTITKTFRYRNDFTLNSFSVDLLYAYYIFEDVSILAGTKINYFIRKDVIATDDFILPIQGQFTGVDKKYINNHRTILIYQNDNVEEISSFNIGATIGFQYKIKLKSLEICPIVLYNFYSTNLMNDLGWKLTTFIFGFDFMFGV